MVQRIYTGTGDEGDTGLFGGGRVPKSHPRVEAYGGVDELNAIIGWTLVHITDPDIATRLASVQPDLFAVGAHLATQRRSGNAPKLPDVPSSRIGELEQWIDEAEAALPELRSFIMPGGAPGGAALHVARTVCRRAERGIVELARSEEIDTSIIVYINRLSDLLFVWARRENQHAGVPETQWLPRG